MEDLESFLSARREAATFRWSATEQWHVTLAVAESLVSQSDVMPTPGENQSTQLP